MRKTITENLLCHECNTYQNFTWDLRLEGKQVCDCPNCGHPHHRTLTEDERARMALLPAEKKACKASK